MGKPNSASKGRNKKPDLAVPGLELLADSLAPRSAGISSSDASEQLLVQWLPSTDSDQRKAIHQELGGTVVRSIHTLAMDQAGEGVLDVVACSQGSNSRNYLLEAYKQRREVKFAEFNGSVHTQAISNDPSLGTLWGMGSGFGSNAVATWAKEFTGKTTTVVGDIDTGLDYTHPDLYLNVWLNQGEIKGLSFYNFLVDADKDGLITFRDLNNLSNRDNPDTKLTDWNGNGYIDAGDLLAPGSGWEDLSDNDGNGYIDDLIGWDFVNRDNDPFDDNGHGTHTAGTIGAMGGNGLGVAGVNWQVQIAGLKFLDSAGIGDIANAILAIDYFTTAKIQAGIRTETGQFVGTNNSWGGTGTLPQTLTSAISRANQNDLLFIAAAGNGGRDLIGDNNDLIANTNTPSNDTTANVIAVAAITSTGALASYSNYGSVSVDLGAPGSGVNSTYPMGKGPLGTNYNSISGTSMATPHVMGAAALLKSAYPTATAAQIKEALLTSAAQTSSLLGKTVTGGRLDIPAALAKLGTLMNPSLPVITVVATDLAAAETSPGAPANTGRFTFTRTGVITASLNVAYNLSGTASSTDYGPSTTPGTITFAAGSPTATLDIAPVDDPVAEATETVILTLATNPTYAIGAASSATITIADNDTSTTPAPVTGLTLWGTTRRDTITGTAGDDRISGVGDPLSSSTNPGRGQIDTLIGGNGADTFVLEDARGVFYNDGRGNRIGNTDYARITDFTSGIDKLQLRTGTTYLTTVSNGVTSLYWDINKNTTLDITGTNQDELIAMIQGTVQTTDFVFLP